MNRQDIIDQNRYNRWVEEAEAYDEERERQKKIAKLKEYASNSKDPYTKGIYLIVIERVENNQPISEADQEFVNNNYK